MLLNVWTNFAINKWETIPAQPCRMTNNANCSHLLLITNHFFSVRFFHQASTKSNSFNLMKSRKSTRNRSSLSNNTLAAKRKTPVWRHHPITININLVPINRCQWAVTNFKNGKTKRKEGRKFIEFQGDLWRSEVKLENEYDAVRGVLTTISTMKNKKIETMKQWMSAGCESSYDNNGK